MKRSIILILAAATLLGAFGCAAQQPKPKYPVSFYYLPNTYTFGVSDTVLAKEQREGLGMENDLQALLTLYFKGPKAEGIRSPFPAGTTLVEMEMRNDTLYLTLSRAFSSLEGAQLSLACAAITKTCLDLSACVNVRISAENATLNGEMYVEMNKSNLLLLDQAQPEATETN